MKPRALAPIVTIIAAELAIAAIVLSTGFTAISDDDFSRVVIAERFVAEPSLDPSGSSWLPLPFLILGTKMFFLGRSLTVARLVAVGESALGLLLLYRAARNLAMSPRAALAGTLLSAAIPTAARLGVSFQPEALTAGLVVYAASTLSKSGRERLFGGLALGAATLCRYEPWPAALAFAAYCAVDAFAAPSGSAKMEGSAPPATAASDGGRALLLAAALAAVAPPLSWMVHGVSRHANAVFFLARVSSYRHALGGAESGLTSLVAYPMAFVRSEPGLLLSAAAVLVAAGRRSAPRLSRFSRLFVLLAALFAFLVAGRFMGGMPTHHEERPLLSIFWAVTLLVAGYAWGEERGGENAPRLLAVGAVACIAIGSLYRFVAPAEEYMSRGAELAIGSEAKHRVGPSDRLLVDTADYGYFAVIAAFGAPERAEAFDRRDPREAQRPDAFASKSELRARLTADRATWFVARRDREGVGSEVGAPVAENERFVLFHKLERSLTGNTE